MPAPSSIAPPNAADEPVLPRGLIFLASLWLIGAWQLSLGGIAPIQPTSTAYVAGVRMMVQCLAIGAIVGWPLLRLSEAPCSWSVRRAIVDLIALSALVQIVIWPLRLVTPWSVGRLLAIDLTLVAWMIAVGAVVAVAARPVNPRPMNTAPGGRGSSVRRTIGMACVLLLALGGPLIAALLTLIPSETLAGARAALTASSPFVALHALASTGAGPLRDPERASAIGVAAVPVMAWLAAWVALGLESRSRLASGQSEPATVS